MSDLLKAINDYLHNHGHYPKVKVSRVFWHTNFWIVAYEIRSTVEIDETVDQWELE